MTPRVYLVRHGHTDWAESGRFAGRIEIDLTDAGAEQISSIATTLVGAGKVLDPKRLVHVFVSPRLRAKNTFKLLLDPLSRLKEGPSNSFEVTETEDITEWDCGIYEGCTVKEITDLRNEKGLDQGKKWHIWSDGCEGGESMEDVTRRLDKFILQIKEIQKPWFTDKENPADVLIVAHGLILRCLWKRWLGMSIDYPISIMFNFGAIAVLSYNHENFDEPAIHIGVALHKEEH